MLARRLFLAATWIAVAITFIVLALHAQQLLAPQRNGPLALAQIMAPHLTLLAALLVPFAWFGRSPGTERPRGLVGISLAALLVVGVMRFGPGLVSFPPEPDGVRLTVLSWNLEATGSGARDLHRILLESDASVVGLQELERSAAAGLEADPEIVARYPYRVLRPRDGSTGIGLLAQSPLLDPGWLDDPSAAWAMLDLGFGERVLVITAHPLPARIEFLSPLPLPVGLDAADRDADLVRLRRDVVDPLAADADGVVVFGDFNVTDREPGYGDLSAGLRDAHAEVGLGPGSTWRPPRLEWLPFGILRIDHVFTGGGASPVWIGTDCTPRESDHCIIHAGVALHADAEGDDP